MKHVILFVIICSSVLGFSQGTINEVIEKYNSNAVPYISVNELKKNYTSFVILDAREQEEFDISHLKNAISIGFENFNFINLSNILTDNHIKVVVYCSIGVRSEIIGKQLIQHGFTNIYNLYGGIFEWKNSGQIVYDNNNKPTENIHTYSKQWRKYLNTGTPTH